MRVTVFGASTETGRAVVERLLDAGHDVTVLARDETDPADFPVDLGDVHVVEGDVQDIQTVEDAVHGADAVVTAFREPLPHTPGTDNADAMHNVLKELDRYTADRLVAITGEKEDAGGLRERFDEFLSSTVGNEPNYERQERLVRESDADWTVVRPAPGDDPDAVAAVVVSLLEAESHVHETVGVPLTT
ncbi:NAD(P)-dependent oxidoreductase [Halospeciosus flavus]|uniref:NAD(P)-dependent oxidoreductase n=1 Tax=Halospeciosus flavus TaxID=3032283 RepID=A0ABD5Z8I3_9EURY|nr:NAD(P)H-binding protein [Halospeciosus flavus]